MKHSQELISLQRTTSTSYRNTRKIIPSNSSSNYNYFAAARSSTSGPAPDPEDFSGKFLLRRNSSATSVSVNGDHHNYRVSRTSRGAAAAQSMLSSLLRSFLSIISFPSIIPTCKWLVPAALSSMAAPSSLGRKVTGTLFGNRRGHVSFAVQDSSSADPVLILELAMSTSALVKEMSSALVRIALECEKTTNGSGRTRPVKLFKEPAWTMYCNGRKCGYAESRACTESDLHVLRTVKSVSVGAGVIPLVDDGAKGSGAEGELLYMRANFERVVGSRDSEAFYMLNPDRNGGPELSIFLLRI